MPKGKLRNPVPKNKKINIDTLTCVMCGKTQSVVHHYQSYNPLHSTGYLPYCKYCLKKMCLDGSGTLNIEGVKQMLKSIDRPFLYDIFKISLSAEGTRDPIGNYMKNIALAQYRNLGFADSVFEPHHENEHLPIKWGEEKDTPIQNTMTDDVVDFFGSGYSDEEYAAMLKKYNFLKNNYPEKTNMHIEALTTYVRYKVKEEMCTARGDVGGAAKWAELANKAATNAKINPSQLSAADLQDGLSTFGQLSRAVEQAVDIIEVLPIFKEKPKDKVDFNMWCYINYIRDLKGLPLCSYSDIYAFYEKSKREFQLTNPSQEVFIEDGDKNE
jgi:hypothetical protein